MNGRRAAETMLVGPNAELFESFRELARAFVGRGEPHTAEWLEWAVDLDVAEFLEWTAAATSNQLDYTVLRGGAMHMYWLVEDGTNVVAVAVLFDELEEVLRRKHGHVHYRVHPTSNGEAMVRGCSS